MKFNKKNFVLAFILVLFIIGGIIGIFTFSVTNFLDDYIIYGENRPVSCNFNDIRSSTSTPGYYCTGLSPQWIFNGIISGSEDKILLSEYCGAIRDDSGVGSFFCTDLNSGFVSATTTEGFKGKNVRADISFDANYPNSGISYQGLSSYKILIDDVIVYDSGKFNSGSSSGGLLDISPSIIDRNEMNIVYRGQVIRENFVPTGNGKISFQTNTIGALKINDFRWKPLFNCEVEADEVVVRDEFAPGTQINIASLSYPPVKFCIDSYPAVVRSITSQGVATDIKGEITRTLANGKVVTVEEGETIMVSYIVDYDSGMSERCNIGDVYNTKTKKCEKFISEQTDTTVVVSNVTQIAVSTNQALIQNRGIFGDNKIELGNTKYLCANEFKEQNFVAPNPRANCWVTDVITPAKTFTGVITGTELVPNQYYTVQPLITATWDSDCSNAPNEAKCISDGGYMRGSGNILFTWTDHSAIDIEPKEQEFETKLNSVADVKFNVYNKFGVSFGEGQSGVKVTRTKDLIFGQKRFDEILPFANGFKEYSVERDTSTLGEVKYELVPFITIGGLDGKETILYDDQKVAYTFFVSGLGVEPQGEIIYTTVNTKCSDKPCDVGYTCKDTVKGAICERETVVREGLPKWLEWTFAGLIGAFIIGLTAFIIKKRK